MGARQLGLIDKYCLTLHIEFCPKGGRCDLALRPWMIARRYDEEFARAKREGDFPGFLSINCINYINDLIRLIR